MISNHSESADKTFSLVFKIDDESKPTVENASTYHQSPFFMPINKGLDLVKSILNDNGKDDARGNNVVAFLGERGSGKTSCMMSVVNILKESKDPYGNPYKESIEEFAMIDPAFFDSSHNITDIFIGEFYRKYEERAKKYNSFSDEKRNGLKELQSEFKSVKKALKYLEKNHSDQSLDEIDALSHLSSGLELKRSLSRLVEKYLKFIDKRNLVVLIDDLDLNIDWSHRMMEEIMKYLMIPNVVILLGAKLNQLKIGIASSYTKYRKEDLLYRYEIDEMAIRYLDKFIPMPNRVFMPEAKNIINSPLRVDLSDGKSLNFPSVAFAVTSLIYQKTRYLFYNHDGVPSLIIPRNLREIRMLVTSLINRKDPVAEDNDIHNDNKAFFKNYFRNQWLPTLDSQYQDFAKDLMEETDISKINKEAIKYLTTVSEAFKNWIVIADDSEDDYSSSSLLRRRLRDISNPANANVNITVGDVMATASTIGEIENSHKISQLVFFIQTFYSMKLYELYDEMTAPENLDENGIVVNADTPQTIPVLKNATDIVLPEYMTLSAGDFFVLTGDSFIPFSKAKASREVRLIDGGVLNDNLKRIISELYDKDKKESKPASKMQEAELKIIEFFVLCSRRVLRMNKAEYSRTKPDNWRQYLDPSYRVRFGDFKNIIFEITAPFFNLIYPEFAYQRFHPDLYDLSLKCNGSLLRSILDNGKRAKNRNDFADLMSRISIRNMEVLSDLYKWLSAKKDSLRAINGDARSILIQYFNQFSENRSHYEVKTYDKKSDKVSFHVIEFNPLAQLAEAIDFGKYDENDRQHLISLFQKIYNPVDELQAGISYTLDEVKHRILEISAPDSLTLNDLIEDIYNHSVSGNLTPQAVINGLMGAPLLSDELLQSLFSPDLRKRYKDLYMERIKSQMEDIDISQKVTNNELRSLKRKESDISDTQKRVNATIEHQTAKMNNLSEQKWKKSTEAVEIRKQMNACMDEINKLSEERDVITSQLSKIGPKVADSKTNLVIVDDAKGEDLLKKLSELDSKVERKKTEYAEKNSVFTKLNIEITIIDNDLAVINGNLEETRNELNNLISQLTSLRDQINEREMRKQHLTSSKLKLEEEYRRVEKKLKAYKL